MTKVLCAGALALAVCAAPLAAEDKAVAKPDATDAATLALEAAAEANAETPFGGAQVVEEQQLATIAGREDLAQVTNAEQSNAVTGNDVGDNSVTGTIVLSDQAFSNTSGFVILNANTGNNVAINASIQVNVALPAQ